MCECLPSVSDVAVEFINPGKLYGGISWLRDEMRLSTASVTYMPKDSHLNSLSVALLHILPQFMAVVNC